jgi:hypothetical protein
MPMPSRPLGASVVIGAARGRAYRTEIGMKRSVRSLAVLAGLSLGVAGAALAPAAAVGPADGPEPGGKPRTVQVQGEQILIDAANGEYVMRGDLVGDWLYVPRTPPLHTSDTLYVEAGTEVFRGCIDRDRNGRCGSRDYRGEMRLAFLYWASFDANGDLIRGQCVHPITGGRGAFIGARGVLNMVDRPIGDQVRTTYRGEVVLNAVPSEGPAPATPVAVSPLRSTTSAGSAERRC